MTVTGEAPMTAANASAARELIPTSFEELDGWNGDDHAAALTSFLRICSDRRDLLTNPALKLSASRARALCRLATQISGKDSNAARRFFETEFTPHRVSAKGFLTGYYEPELPASRTPGEVFNTPLLKAPDGLVPVTASIRPKGWPEDISHGRRTADGLVTLPDRGAIMDGALDEENLELVYLRDPVDAFFVHVQGSARLRLDDGTVMRVGYAGKTGHPYTSIARVLVERGEGTPEQLTMSGLRQWLADHPDKRDDLFRQNRSFIFFREIVPETAGDGPVGALGLPLLAGRSLAVDPTHIPYGSLVFLQSGADELPSNQLGFPRLVVADDTGSAIKGPARGDLFVGSGEAAGDLAGELRHDVRMTLLLPKPESSGGGQE